MTEFPELDEIDEKLIELLTADGRLSNRAIARDLDISEGTLRKRLKRLEDSGTINFGLVVDVRATGMAVAGYLYVQACAGDTLTIAELIAKMDQCAMCCITTGPANIRAYLYGADAQELANAIETISLQQGVAGVEFREAVGHAQHRYELIMASGTQGRRWGK